MIHEDRHPSRWPKNVQRPIRFKQFCVLVDSARAMQPNSTSATRADAKGAGGPLEAQHPCFCTRADIQRETERSADAPHTPDGMPLYPVTCRSFSPMSARPASLYASHDDTVQGVMLAVPGTDLKPATYPRRLLEVLMG